MIDNECLTFSVFNIALFYLSFVKVFYMMISTEVTTDASFDSYLFIYYYYHIIEFRMWISQMYWTFGNLDLTALYLVEIEMITETAEAFEWVEALREWIWNNYKWINMYVYKTYSRKFSSAETFDIIYYMTGWNVIYCRVHNVYFLYMDIYWKCISSNYNIFIIINRINC